MEGLFHSVEHGLSLLQRSSETVPKSAQEYRQWRGQQDSLHLLDSETSALHLPMLFLLIHNKHHRYGNLTSEMLPNVKVFRF